MKRFMVWMFGACFLSANVALSQEAGSQVPAWVSSATAGAEAALVESWYYEGFMKSKEAKEAKPLKEMAEDEIRYISTTGQRNSFKKLKTSEDLNQFMKEFWAEIDPSPGTMENELQREYYERFAFANEQFSDGQEGWKTDQGRVYILYGPPDDIERHAWVNPNFLGNGATIKDAEIWLYTSSTATTQWPNVFRNYLKGMVKFVFADFHGFGDYRQIYSTEEGEVSDPRLFARF